MINVDKNALLCDLAETYHIYDIKALPLSKVALFSAGLRENSRIKMKIANAQYTFTEMMLMSIIDRLAILVWQNSKDAVKGRNMPKSLINMLMNTTQENDISSFNSASDFEHARTEIINKGEW